MILQETVYIKYKGNSKLDYYKKKGYVITNTDFLVNVVDLLPNTDVQITVKCDFCDNIKQVSYKNYYRNVNRTKYKKYCCSFICRSNKTSKTCLEKYGVEKIGQSKEIREKIYKTNLERYNTTFSFQSEQVKQKIKNTNLERYGVENPGQSELIKEKIKNTNLERYGVENPGQSDLIKEKIKKTNLEKYNSPFYVTSEYFLHNPLIKANIINGKKKLSFDENYRSRFNICKDKKYIKYIGDKVSLFKCDKSHNFEINSDNFISRTKNHIPLCTICNPIGENTSIKEKELLEFIKSFYNGEVLHLYRDGLEIDIYLPKLKIGFEFNGIHWHSKLYKENNYHVNKSNYFKEKGIRIIHIWEDDWDNKKDIIKSNIYNNIIPSTNINNQFTIKEVTDKDICINFLNTNHIDGHSNSLLYLGIYSNNILVSIMSFSNCNDEWYIDRFCNRVDLNMNTFDILVNYFITNYNINILNIYSDNNYFDITNSKLNFIKRESETQIKYIVNKKRVNESELSVSFDRENKKYIIEDLDKIKYTYVT
jgi:hypothetical protein